MCDPGCVTEGDLITVRPVVAKFCIRVCLGMRTCSWSKRQPKGNGSTAVWWILCAFVCVCMCVCACIHVCVHACVCACMHVCVGMCINLCMCVIYLFAYAPVNVRADIRPQRLGAGYTAVSLSVLSTCV
jgi:hypothetical protein